MSEATTKKAPGFSKGMKKTWASMVKYFKDVRAELKKVAWPTPKQVRNNTMIVLICIAVVGVIICLLDILFGQGFDFLINTFK